MNTITASKLLALSAVTVAVLSLAFVADVLTATHVLSAFAATFIALIACHDYARPVHRHRYLAAVARSTPRAAHPLAA